jgi:hypothetical protein
MTKTTKVDRFGFPIRPCTRCGGSGTHSYNSRDGNRCYGCSGSGWQHPRGKVGQAWEAFVAAVREQRRPSVGRLAAGDEITFDQTHTGRPTPDAVWHTVAALEVDQTRAAGWMAVFPLHSQPEHADHDHRTGCECYIETAWYATLTFADGTSRQVTTNSMVIRKGAVDPAPFVEQATS